MTPPTRIAPQRLLLLLTTLVTTVLLAAACSNNTPQPAAVPVPGVTAFTIGVDLWFREDGEERRIVQAEQGRQILSPAIAPDGERIAFVFFQVAPGPDTTVGADLAIYLPEDGVRIVLEHQQRSEYFWNPRWTPDGQSLIYTHEAPGMEIAVERLDLASGETRLLRTLARDADIAPDGQRIVFIDDPYGGAPRLLVRDLRNGAEYPLDAAGDWEIYVFRIPRWTPDGQSIVFAGAAQLPTVSADPLLAARNSNGPEDIWLVDAGGGQPRMIAAITEDQPDFAVSSDGRHILARGSFGVYIAALAQGDPFAGAPFAIAPGEFHGWHDWRGRLTDAQWTDLIERAAAGAQ